MSIKINTNFCGGNANIVEISGDYVHFLPELRDTSGDWFYWAFEVTGAAGRTVTFDMKPKNYVGYFGAAISNDLYDWRWSDNALPDRSGFTYTFGENENRTYFAHSMLYHPSRFYRFAESLGIAVRTFGNDNKGTPLHGIVIGTGERNIILTARHHCCESTGNYIMEGIVSEFKKSPMDGFRLTAIPFVDADGVVNGDQGKNRIPHDHNRDYIDEPIYNGVKVVKSMLDAGDTAAMFDLHSPWHLGGRNNKIFIVRKRPEEQEKMVRFGKCFEAQITPEAMKYDSVNDLDPGVEWNTLGTNIMSAAYASEISSVKLAFTLETTYFGEIGNVVSQDKLVETGRCLYKAIKSFFETEGDLS